MGDVIVALKHSFYEKNDHKTFQVQIDSKSILEMSKERGIGLTLKGGYNTDLEWIDIDTAEVF